MLRIIIRLVDSPMEGGKPVIEKGNFVRKGTAEGMAWDFSLSANVKNFGGRLTARVDDIGYGSINEITGATENSILYT